VMVRGEYGENGMEGGAFRGVDLGIVKVLTWR
jgi:hypothetical protein